MLFDRAADARQGNGSAILAELDEGTSQGVDAEMEYNTVNWREPHMKTLTGLLLLAVSAAISPAADPVRLNPKRFSAAEIRQEGDVAHLQIGTPHEDPDRTSVAGGLCRHQSSRRSRKTQSQEVQRGRDSSGRRCCASSRECCRKGRRPDYLRRGFPRGNRREDRPRRGSD